MHSIPNKKFKKILFASIFFAFSNIYARDDAGKVDGFHFDPRFLGSNADGELDLSRFSRESALEPGEYLYDFYLNGVFLGRENIKVMEVKGKENSKVCFSPLQISKWGVNPNSLEMRDEYLRQINENECVDIEVIIPDFNLSVDVTDFILKISVPQANLARNPRGYISPEKWQQGTYGGFVNYSLNSYQSHYKNSGSFSSSFGSIFTGFNAGAWRLRYNASLQHDSSSGSHFRKINAYAARDVAALNSQLVVGEYYTKGKVFESVPFTGVSIGSDERMLPNSQAGFAPDIRGVAETNAMVRIFQNGNQIYETTVSPGAFVIDDLNNTGYSGDLEVVITESNGQIKRFTVAYASIVQLLRPGASRYDFVLGRYRARGVSHAPKFAQAIYERGLSNLLTGYGGAIVAQDYLAGQLGFAFNTRFGAFSLDGTHADARKISTNIFNSKSSSSGQSYRVSYSKLLSPTDTNITLAAYKFTSKGYLNFNDFARLKSNAVNYMGDGGQWQSTDNFVSSPYAQRNRFQISLNQKLGDYGSIVFIGSTQSYWNSIQKRYTTYQLGYNKSFQWGSLNLNISRTDRANGQSVTQSAVSFNIPFGDYSSAYTSMLHSTDGGNSINAGVSSSAGERRNLYYSVYGLKNKYNNNSITSGGGSIQYDGRYTQVGASASVNSEGTKQASVSLNGSAIAHAGGVNFVKNQGETFAVVHVPGASGAYINGSNSNRVNSRGYGVASSLIPYRENSVSVDPQGTSLDVEIIGTAKTVAPTAGAIILIEYETKQGRAVLLSLEFKNGLQPPLGSEVINSNGMSVGQVGQSGRVFLRGIEDLNNLTVKWGRDALNECHIVFDMNNLTVNNDLPFLRESAVCQ